MTDTPTYPIDKELVAKRFSYSRSTYDREAEDLLEQKKQSNCRKLDLAHLHFDNKHRHLL